MPESSHTLGSVSSHLLLRAHNHGEELVLCVHAVWGLQGQKEVATESEACVCSF